jgi:fructose-1,6-bisphosphatase I
VTNLLDIVPDKLHTRTPLVIGSVEDVKLVESFIADRRYC